MTGGDSCARRSPKAWPDRPPGDQSTLGPFAHVDRQVRVIWLFGLGLTVTAGFLVALGLSDLMQAGILGRAIGHAQTITIGPLLVMVVAVTFLAERFWPAVPRRATARAHLVDAGYLGLYAALGPVVTLLNTGFAVAVERYAGFLIIGHLSIVPPVMVVGLILVGIDAMNWAAHVANHRTRPLWRFHALHHSQEDMSVLTTFRTHPLTHASYLPALLPALLLLASGTVPAAALVVYGCLVALSHANLRWSYGPLGRVVVSPAFHRIHHADSGVPVRRGANFGFVLAIWDRLAGTAMFPDGSGPLLTGIAGRTVPVEQDAPRWKAWRVMVTQVMQPFRLRSGLEG